MTRQKHTLVRSALLYVSGLFLVLIATAGCDPVVNMTRSGESYLMSGDNYRAIDEYTRAINLNSGDAMAYMGRAVAYEQLGYFDKALADLNTAVALLPKDGGVRLDRGLVHEIMGHYQLALEDYTFACQLDPTNSNAFFNQGNAYMNLGNQQRAIASYQTAARLGHAESQNILRSRGIGW